MIQSLKRKMLTTMMFFITIIILAFLIVINVVPRQSGYQEAIAFLNQNVLPENTNVPRPGNNNNMTPPDNPAISLSPKPENGQNPNENMLFHSNLISIHVDATGNILNWSSNREDLYEDSTIDELSQSIYKQQKKEGSCLGYYYVCRNTPDGIMMVLLDNRVAFHNLRTVLFITIIAGIIVWIAFFILCIFLVNRMTRPITEAFEKQKQFISDAGHELKTPVAVISANTEVLAQEIGENKWLSYIHTETKRMDLLIKNLMQLAQMDDPDRKYTQTRINLSQTILGAALPLESLAFENGTVMEFDIAPDIYIQGNKEQMEQLVVILLSNAIRYGNERGLIRVSLSKQHKTVVFSVFNTGMGIRPEDKEKIFERFYRVEKERSRKGGNYGLGLAIAQSIVTEHHGKITVESEYGKNVTFLIFLGQAPDSLGTGT